MNIHLTILSMKINIKLNGWVNEVNKIFLNNFLKKNDIFIKNIYLKKIIHYNECYF
jgi:hypothetical protein